MFDRELNREKWDSRSMIYRAVTESFASWGKKFVGSVEAYMKDAKTIILIGERESDKIVFETQNWHRDIFDTHTFKMKCSLIIPDAPEVMLMGTTRTLISPSGEEELKLNYRISRIQAKGTNKYEFKFNDAQARNLALDLGVPATAGLKIKLSEWRKVLDIQQCIKCQKYGHVKVECKSRAWTRKHESKNCPDIRCDDLHRCFNCKDKPGYKTHNTGEKMKCEFFLSYNMGKCNFLKLEPEKKYCEACSCAASFLFVSLLLLFLFVVT
jgi:hypothetical protein